MSNTAAEGPLTALVLRQSTDRRKPVKISPKQSIRKSWKQLSEVKKKKTTFDETTFKQD